MKAYIWHIISKSAKYINLPPVVKLKIKNKLKYIQSVGIKKFLTDCTECYLSKANKEPEIFLAVTAIVKNEAPYIKEWLEFHKLVGVEKFYIYNNDSTDNLYEILKEYIQSQEVIYKEFPGQCNQCKAYRDSIKHNRHKVKYMAFIDIDEFITPIQYDSIPQFLLSLKKQINHNIDAVGINWIMHGFNEKATKPEGLVCENFKHCSFSTPNNKHVKSIVDLTSVITMNNPHYCIHKIGAKTINAEGNDMAGPFNEPPTFKNIVINHYWTKSYEEYAQKINRGRATVKTKRGMLPFEPKYFSEDIDYSMDKFLPDLKKKMGAN